MDKVQLVMVYPDGTTVEATISQGIANAFLVDVFNHEHTEGFNVTTPDREGAT